MVGISFTIREHTPGTNKAVQGAAPWGMSGSAEDAQRSLGATLGDGGTFYYAARFSLTDMRPNSNNPMSSIPQYFLGLKDSTVSNLNARLYVDNPLVASPTTYSLAITAGSDDPDDGGARVPYATDLTFG